MTKRAQIKKMFGSVVKSLLMMSVLMFALSTTNPLKAQDTAEDTARQVREAVEGAANDAEEVFDAATDTIMENLPDIPDIPDIPDVPEIPSFPGVTGAARNAAGQLEGAAAGALEAVEGVTGQLEGAAGQLEGAVGGALDAVEGVTTQVQGIVTGVTDTANGVVSGLTGGALTSVEDAIAAGQTLINFAEDPIGTLRNLAQEEVINMLVNGPGGPLTAVLSNLPVEAVTELIGSLGLEGISALSGDLLSVIPGDVLGLAIDGLSSFFGSFPGVEQVINSIQSAVTGALEATGIFGAGGLPAGGGSTCALPGALAIGANHLGIQSSVNSNTSAGFTGQRSWMLNTFFVGQVLPALMAFTEQMSAVAMHQTMIIGTFLDAKHQLETQRLVQELQVEAHKDYQPSEDFCYFGTNARSLANSEAKSQFNAYMLSRRQQARHLGQYNIGGGQSQDEDKAGRWEQFKEHFCDPQDNNWLSSQPASGLALACTDPVPNPEYTNADIDYTRLVENAHTISLNKTGLVNFEFNSNVSEFGGGALGPADRAVMALGNNLYGHNVLTRKIGSGQLRLKNMQPLYLALRSVAAKRAVAENSFNAIVSMKSAGTTHKDNSGGFSGEDPADTWKFLGAVLAELGIPESEIQGMIGQEPSYYAQLEILSKKIYQSPNFFANLYDKPANIKRKSVALKAIELMVDRAIYESQIRQEMVASVLLSARLREPFKEAERNLQAGGR